MKLLYKTDSKENKVYTLKPDKETKPAHYKFIKVKDAPKKESSS
jgi:hypothetical protein